MPQLEKYAFFTQLFWFFSLFFIFFVLLLQKILPAIARSLKFRQKLVFAYKKSISSFESPALPVIHNHLINNFLSTTKDFSAKVQLISKGIVLKNIGKYFRTRFLKKSYKYVLRTRRTLIKAQRRPSVKKITKPIKK